MKKGKLIVIEGIDGTGKATQTELLAEKFIEAKIDFITADFPRYESNFWGHHVGRMLTGEFGNLFAISPYLAVLPYMLDEADGSKKIIKPALASGKFVLSNRYFTSNVHQIAKQAEEKREDYAAWLWEAGYNQMGIIKPDLVIVLLVDEKICQANVLNKAKRTYAKGQAMDQAERNFYHQMESAKEYRKMCKKEPNKWILIECSKNGKMLPKEEINATIYATIKAQNII